MDQGEREAVLNLVPYFDQNHRVVFDVGSNKGEWSDILIENVDHINLFEPNVKLLNYTEIKYCHLRNVSYYDCVVSNDSENKTYYQYLYEHNGLSSIHKNPKWEYLKPQIFDLDSIELNCLLSSFKHIDLLKIDVEGAEWEVIQGSEELIEQRIIKFIQIEYSEHYKVPGYTFQQVIDFMKQYDYLLYQFNGRKFIKPNFEEDYRHKNYFFMQEFTEDWNSEFRKNTMGMKFDFVLEIGSFEGLTTCYICDLLLNPGGRVICVDPLDEVYLTEGLDEEAQKMNKDFTMFKGQYDRFIRNTKNKPVELKRMLSRDMFKLDGFNAFKFDFIYIDGDHRRAAVYYDACHSWEVLKHGGYILFDDYEWGSDTQRGINRFLRKYDGYLTVIVKDYQVMIQKNVIK